MLNRMSFFLFFGAYCTCSRLHYSLFLIDKQVYFLGGRIAAASLLVKVVHRPSPNFALRTQFDSHQHLSTRSTELA